MKNGAICRKKKKGNAIENCQTMTNSELEFLCLLVFDSEDAIVVFTIGDLLSALRFQMEPPKSIAIKWIKTLKRLVRMD